MADDKETTESTDEAAPKGGMKKILIILGAVMVLGGGGAGAYLAMSGGEVDAEAAAEVAVAESVNLEMSPFLVNLSDPGGKHYLKTTLTLELNNQQAADWVNGHLPKVRDRVLTILSSKESGELLTARGKFTLRDEMIRELNAMVKDGRTEAVYLTEFMVQ